MAVRTISTAIKLEGEQEFKRQMGLVNSGLKTLKSEMSLVTAEFSGQANTVDALSAKNRVLRQQYDQQAEKVKLLEKAVREASETYGDADKRTDEYIRLRRDLLGQGGRMSFDFNSLVTDRTQADVEARNDKGVYQAADLNRVTAAMEELANQFSILGYSTAGYARQSSNLSRTGEIDPCIGTREHL